MRILITGGTGFIGKALCQHFIAQGHKIIILSRQPSQVVVRKCGDVQVLKSLDELDSRKYIDVCINLAGAPIADKRWSASRKRELCNSRYQITSDLVNLIARLEQKPRLLISGSAVGYYGDQKAELVDESTLPHSEFTHTLCNEWESIANNANPHCRVVNLRTGLVLGAEGGFLSKMWLPFQLGLGGKLGKGDQYMPWIHLEDMLGIVQFLIKNSEVKGPVNATAPEPVENETFVKALAKELHRPCLFTTPAIALRLVLGEMAVLLLAGQKAIPKKLLDAGYEFRFTSLNSALNDVVRKKGYFH